MEKALQKAIEGGFDLKSFIALPDGLMSSHDDFTIAVNILKEKLLLTPSFWQCLGKAEGWNNDSSHRCSLNSIERMGKSKSCGFCFGEGKDGVYWLDVWHSFIKHLASGKDANSFFEGLLK